MKGNCRQLLIQLNFYQFCFWLGLIDVVYGQFGKYGQYSYPDTLPQLFPTDSYDHMNFTTKCFGDLGCFYTGPPWYNPAFRPVTKTPEDDTVENTKFMLYTRSNRDKPYFLQPNPPSLQMSPYDESAPLKVMIHGYYETPSIYDGIVTEFLKYAPFNLVVVDWTISDHYPYAQAVANARLVAAYVAKLIKFIMAQTGLSPEKVHVIGHSLGGQLVGFVGERVNNIGRITGLDPAGLYFRGNAPKEIRLDRSDAIFVDVIQTNIGDTEYTGIGLDLVYGHAVFRVNGGSHQPGCDYQPSNQLIDNQTPYNNPNQCSHLRALDYFKSSINTCKYNATACFAYNAFEAGLCDDTPYTNRMGYHAVKPPYQLVYYLDTTSEAPYCEPSSE